MRSLFGLSHFTLINAVLFQSLWFACVLGVGANGLHWTAMLTGLAILVAVFFSPTRANDLGVAVCALLLGLVADSIWINCGFLIYPDYSSVPYWIGLLWFGMGLTINHSLAWFRDQRLFGPLIVGCFAPVTYLTGQRFGAVTVPDLTPFVVIALSWVIIFALLSYLARSQWFLRQRIDA